MTPTPAPALDAADTLRDLHLPDPVGWWPPAPGWWLLLLLVAAVIAGVLLWRRQRFHALAWKREALAEWQSIHARFLHDRDNTRLLADLSVLLKRVCISRHGREQSAGLTGEQWLAFLDQTGGGQDFTRGAGRVLLDQRYGPDPHFDAAQLLDLTRKWLNRQC